MSKFEFTVSKARDEDKYQVSLPHQCDDWQILGDYDDYIPYEKAVEQMAIFIKEATEALNALVEKREL